MEDEGISQRTYMKDPWTWTMMKRHHGSGGLAGWRGQKGKYGTTIHMFACLSPLLFYQQHCIIEEYELWLVNITD